MIIGSTKEDLSIEKRVALTPDAAKNIIGLGLNIYIEKNYADHLGIKDEDFKKVGVEIKDSSKEVLKSCNLLIKVNYPREDEINNLNEKTILIGMFNPSQNKNKINEIIKKHKVIFSRTSTTYYSSSIYGCVVFTIKFSWLQSCNRFNL